MTPAQRYALLFALAGTIAGGALYLVDSSGNRLPDGTIAGTARVCGLPSIGPAAFYTALGVPTPTGPNGTGAGDCLAPNDAEQLLRNARVVASILPRWRAAGLGDNQCAAGIVAVEFPVPSADGGTIAGVHEELIQVCGPAPSASSTATIEKLRRLPGTSVNLVGSFGPHAKPGGAKVIQRWFRGSYPAAANNLYPCACRPRSDDAGACLASSEDGGVAPFGVELPSGKWSGGCTRKPCGEQLELAEQYGLNYSMPSACQ
jgi:hypothetical protein